ncbi:MAG: hypothetical protein AABZ14_07345, partial [Candidatus Margulisiibacteriota bacterium]
MRHYKLISFSERYEGIISHPFLFFLKSIQDGSKRKIMRPYEEMGTVLCRQSCKDLIRVSEQLKASRELIDYKVRHRFHSTFLERLKSYGIDYKDYFEEDQDPKLKKFYLIKEDKRESFLQKISCQTYLHQYFSKSLKFCFRFDPNNTGRPEVDSGLMVSIKKPRGLFSVETYKIDKKFAKELVKEGYLIIPFLSGNISLTPKFIEDYYQGLQEGQCKKGALFNIFSCQLGSDNDAKEKASSAIQTCMELFANYSLESQFHNHPIDHSSLSSDERKEIFWPSYNESVEEERKLNKNFIEIELDRDMALLKKTRGTLGVIGTPQGLTFIQSWDKVSPLLSNKDYLFRLKVLYYAAAIENANPKWDNHVSKRFPWKEPMKIARAALKTDNPEVYLSGLGIQVKKYKEIVALENNFFLCH